MVLKDRWGRNGDHLTTKLPATPQRSLFVVFAGIYSRFCGDSQQPQGFKCLVESSPVEINLAFGSTHSNHPSNSHPWVGAQALRRQLRF